MYDIKPLEEAWKKYEFNKRKPWYLGTSILLIIIFILFYVFNKTKTKDEIKIFDEIYKNISQFSKNNTEKRVDLSINAILVNGSLNKLEVVNDLAMAKNINENISTDDLLVDIPILEIKDILSKSNTETMKKEKVYIDIFETTSITAYEDVERRFKQTGDIDDALFLAKSYYKKENFEKSEYWALETNKLDSSLEESFFIFVKSKFKLGKRNEAISILNSYLKQTSSQEARVLLEQFKNIKL